MEIYNERIKDLLDVTKTNLKVRENKNKGIFIEEASEVYVDDEQDIYEMINLASNNRHISETKMNEGSSRSHLIFLLHIF